MAPEYDDCRVIVQDLPVENKPWATIVRVPYLKGWNLAGLGLLTIGTCFMVWGVGYLKTTGPILITLGALILGVKRVKSFWQRRSLAR